MGIDNLIARLESQDPDLAREFRGEVDRLKLDLVGGLAASIAHECNNKLSIIIGYAESLLYSEIAPAERESLDAIASAGNNLAGFIKAIRLYGGKGNLSRKNLRIDDLVSSAAARFPGPARMVCRIDPADAEVYGDPEDLDYALSSLIRNAHEAMPDGGELCISAAFEDVAAGEDLFPGRYLKVKIQDFGPGLPDDVLKNPFQPHFNDRAGKVYAGMGLAAAWGVVKSHGGLIRVESEQGKGSAFTIYLPGPDSALDSEYSGHNGRSRVLLVESDDLVRNMASTLLGKLGYECIGVSGYPDALKAHSSARSCGKRIDAVILEKSGSNQEYLESLRQIRGMDPDVAFLVCDDGLSDSDVVRKEPNVVAVICKPYTPITIKEAVDTAVNYSKRPR